MLHIFIFHGFKSTAKEIAAFDLTGNYAGDFAPCHVVNSDWYAGAPYVLGGNGIKAISMLAENIDALRAEWQEAAGNMDICSNEVACFINGLADGEPVLLVGHSMGAEIIARIVPQITHHIDLYLFLMAGVIDHQAAEQLLANDNIVQVINFLSARDFLLRKQFPEMVSAAVRPVGLHAIGHDKAINYPMTLGHSDYLRDAQVLSRYRAFIRGISARD